MTEDEPSDIRRMAKGNWFWIDKALIRQYGPKLGAFGVAVYSCLASFANARQTCYPSQDRIAQMLGCSRATVNRAIRALEANGLIAIERRGRYPQVYHLLRVRCNSTEALMSPTDAFDVTQVRTNNNHLSRHINNNGRAGGDIRRVIHSRAMNTGSSVADSESLAVEIAEKLDDKPNLSFYRLYACRHPESLLRYALREVLATPVHKIRRSRAALFRYLVDHYAKRETDNPGH